MDISQKLTEALGNRYELEKWKANDNVAINQCDGSYFKFKFRKRKLLTITTHITAGKLYSIRLQILRLNTTGAAV